MNVRLSVSGWYVRMCVLIPDRTGNPAFCQLGWLMGSSWRSDRMRVWSAGGLPRGMAHTHSQTPTQIHNLHILESQVGRSNKAVSLLFLHSDSITSLKLYSSSLTKSENLVFLFSHLQSFFITSSFLCSLSLFHPFFPVTIFTSSSPSTFHLLLSPSLPFCPLLPPLALPDVTPRPSGLLLRPCLHACVLTLCSYMYFLSVYNIFGCVWMCECDVLIHPIDQSRTPDSHHPWQPSGRCLTLPRPNTSWHPINLQPPCIHTYMCVCVTQKGNEWMKLRNHV